MNTDTSKKLLKMMTSCHPDFGKLEPLRGIDWKKSGKLKVYFTVSDEERLKKMIEDRKNELS